MRFFRPLGFLPKDALRAALAASAVKLQLPDGVALVINACRPLYDEKAKLPKGWHPDVTAEHAKDAMQYARKMLDGEAITIPEYDFICEKLRRVLLRPLPSLQPETTNVQGANHFTASLENLA